MALTRVILGLQLAFTLLVAVVVLYGRMQSVPEKIAVLHMSQCTPPCWNGITPGVTQIDRANQLLHSEFDLADYASFFETSGQTYLDLYHSETGVPCITIGIDGMQTRPNTVNEIMFVFHTETGCASFDIWDMVAFFGTPDYVVEDLGNFSTQTPNIGYRLPGSRGITVQFKYYPDDGSSNVDVIQFFNGSIPFDPRVELHPWRGIGVFNRQH